MLVVESHLRRSRAGRRGSYGASSPGAPGLPYCMLWCDPNLKPVRPRHGIDASFRAGTGHRPRRLGRAGLHLQLQCHPRPRKLLAPRRQGGFTLYARDEGFSIEAGPGAKTSDTHSMLLFEGIAQDAEGRPDSDPVTLTRCDVQGKWVIAGGDLQNAYRRKAQLSAYTGRSPIGAVRNPMWRSTIIGSARFRRRA